MYETVGARVRRLRESHAWLQRELAERAHVAAQTISAIEVGRLDGAYVASDIMGRLAHALGVSRDELLGEAPPPKRIQPRRHPKPSERVSNALSTLDEGAPHDGTYH